MDNYVIGLLPTTTPTDDMKIAVWNANGRYAVTIADLKKFFGLNDNNNGGGDKQTFDFNCTVKSSGQVYKNMIPDLTNDELKSGIQIDVTTEYRDPIKWTTSAEGVDISSGNSGYNVSITLDDFGGRFLTGSEIAVYSETNGVEDTFNFKIKG